MEKYKNKYNGVVKVDDTTTRNKNIIITSIIGIVTNFFLALFKAIVGFLSGSISIVLDSVNNISDVASSVITIIGTRLATKKPDKEHPFGHGRMEYLSSLIISIIILYAGFTSIIESIKKLINPGKLEYTVFSIVVVIIAVFVKIFLGLYVKSKGKQYNSSSLINSGNDALLDSVISFSTLLSALIFLLTGISIEAYLGIIISIVIIKTGIDMIRRATSSILGERVDIELIKSVKKTILSYPDVLGVYDIIFNNYGPNSYYGSVHIEVSNTHSIDYVDELLRNITSDVYTKHGIVLSAIGIYSIDKTNPDVRGARKKIKKILSKYNTVLQMHGFYFNKEKKTIQFDIVISFEEVDKSKLYDEIYDKIKKIYPDYDINISFDNDFSVSI